MWLCLSMLLYGQFSNIKIVDVTFSPTIFSFSFQLRSMQMMCIFLLQILKTSLAPSYIENINIPTGKYCVQYTYIVLTSEKGNFPTSFPICDRSFRGCVGKVQISISVKTSVYNPRCIWCCGGGSRWILHRDQYSWVRSGLRSHS